MLVSVPLHLDTLPGKPHAARPGGGARRALRRREAGQVVPADDAGQGGGSSPRRSTTPTCWSCASSPTTKHGQAVLVARLDNLGKGASGAAVQNIGLMLGV